MHPTRHPKAHNEIRKRQAVVTNTAMRLLTHNFLQSTVRGTTRGYPLGIRAVKVVLEESPFDSQLVHRMLPKINYETLQKACEDLTEPCKKQEIELPKIPETLPSELGDSLVLDLYRVLYDIHVEEGFLVCPDTGREFAIKDGIPNMILHEDEL